MEPRVIAAPLGHEQELQPITQADIDQAKIDEEYFASRAALENQVPLSDQLKFMLLGIVKQYHDLLDPDEHVNMVILQQGLEGVAILYDSIFDDENLTNKLQPRIQKRFAAAAKIKISEWHRKDGKAMPDELEAARQQMMALCDQELKK